MNKLIIHIYITPRAASEVKPNGVELVPYRHNFSHPDCEIVIWKQRGIKVAGRYDEIRHCVMVTLQASGASVAALRDYSNRKKQQTKSVSKKQLRLI